MLALMGALFTFSFIVAPFSLPWDLALTPMAIVFLWLGEVWMSGFGEVDAMAMLRSPLTASALVIAVSAYLWSAPLDMKLGDLGTPYASVIAAAAWPHLVLLGCTLAAGSRMLKASLIPIGQASLVILFTHRLFTDRFLPNLYPPLLIVVSIALPYVLYRLFKASGPLVRLLFPGEPLPARTKPLPVTG